MNITIRNATVDDAAKLLGIYAPYVKNTAISFETEAPSLDEFRGRIENISKKYAYILAEADGEIIGYAYGNQLKTRSAYYPSVETTIYLKPEAKRRGIGTLLYCELEKKLREKGITNLYACIAYAEGEDPYLDNTSMYFHEKNGYALVGKFNKCAVKFGRKYTVIWMEKIL